MANVVGILVLLLIVVQVSVGGAVERILGDVKPPTAAQLEEAQEEWLLASQQLEERRGQWQALGEPRQGSDDVEKLARLRARSDELELAIAQARGELARVEVAVEKLGDKPYESERVVRLPDPRPAPAGAREVNFFCRYGRVNVANLPRLFSALDAGWREAIGAATSEMNIPTADYPRIIQYFAQRRVGDGPYRWSVQPDAQSGRIEASLTWADTGAGEQAGDLGKTGSDFAMQLQNLDPAAHYLRFYVWGDSFEVYLAARVLAEEKGFSVGWRAFPIGMDPVVGPTREGENRID